jgi:hypothetical protein
MIGRRTHIEDLQESTKPGDYWKGSNGRWWCAVPVEVGEDELPIIGALGRHEVTEHDDGTITVSPSILVQGTKGEELYHGWLEHGVWRSA